MVQFPMESIPFQNTIFFSFLQPRTTNFRPYYMGIKATISKYSFQGGFQLCKKEILVLILRYLKLKYVTFIFIRLKVIFLCHKCKRTPNDIRKPFSFCGCVGWFWRESGEFPRVPECNGKFVSSRRHGK